MGPIADRRRLGGSTFVVQRLDDGPLVRVDGVFCVGTGFLRRRALLFPCFSFRGSQSKARLPANMDRSRK